ncbi:MAG TPA: Hsp33 family molecular chaperone HslO [Steroidobacteraceae bacterium]|jgi:molecular chaperone Hsp33
MKTASEFSGDQVRRFIFEGQAVRGHWTHLDSAWQELRAHRRYPPLVEELLGHALAACMLLAATLKFRGTLTFQLQGDGIVNLLVAQCTDDNRMRAVARFDEQSLAALVRHAPPAEIFRQLTGEAGRITVTVEAEETSARYQGVVPLTGDSLAQSLEAYFASSEQLPTRVVLAADGQRAAGLLVQKLPDPPALQGRPGDAWQEAQWGLRRLTPAMLLGGALEPNLAAIFPAQDVRLFGAAPVTFECRCNPDRVAGVLRALGSEEIREVLREQGSVTVTCEFCRRPYSFDSIDIETLFADSTQGTEAIH